MKIVVDMNLSPDWIPVLTDIGCEAVHWLTIFWFDPDSLEFEGFHLLDGTYQPIPPTEQGWRWSAQLGLYLGVFVLVSA
jgi:hypothetical protein